MDQRTRKLMTMHKTLYSRDNTYSQEKKEEEDLPELMIAKMQSRIHGNTKKRKERPITAVSSNHGNIISNRKTTKTRKQN